MSATASTSAPALIVADRAAGHGGGVALLLPSWSPEAVRLAAESARERGGGLVVLRESCGSGSRFDRRWDERCHLLPIVLSLYPDVDVELRTVPRGGLVAAVARLPVEVGLVVVGSQRRPWCPWFLDISLAGRLAARPTLPLAVVPRRHRGSWRR